MRPPPTVLSAPLLAAAIVWALAGAFVAASPAIAADDELDRPAPAEEEQSADEEAPQSRAEALRSARRQKFGQLRPPERESGEDLVWYVEDSKLLEKFAQGWHGLHPAFGGLPSGSGFAGGVWYQDLGVGTYWAEPDDPNRLDLSASFRISTKGYIEANGEAAIRNLGGIPLNVASRAEFRRYTELEFFGLGPDSRRADEGEFLQEDVEAGVRLWWQAPDWLRIGGGVRHLETEIDAGRSSGRGGLFDPRLVPGLERQPRYVIVEGFGEIDWRDAVGYPGSGGRYRIAVSSYDDRDFGAFDFRRYRIDLEQYLPFFNGHRIVALRARAVMSDTDAGQQVPFYLQPTLGGSQELRAFSEQRFRGRNSLLLTAEYRWEAWLGLDMAVFADAGKVVPERGDLDLEDLELSYGVGARWRYREALFMRWDLAFGREGGRFYFTFDNVF